MSGYYPFGPHGPRSSPTQVTPNPTPAYVPPPMPAAPSYSNPVSYGGGGYAVGTGAGNYVGGVGLGGPARKSYIIAVILSGIFGPLGLFYANAKAAKLLLLLIAANVIWQVLTAPLADIYRAGGFLSFIGDNQTLGSLWSVATFLSVILSIASIRSFRKKQEADKKDGEK